MLDTPSISSVRKSVLRTNARYAPLSASSRSVRTVLRNARNQSELIRFLAVKVCHMNLYIMSYVQRIFGG